MANKFLYIPNLDCKDLVIASKFDDPRRRKYGYALKKRNGEYNPKKFSAALDWSLDQMKLREASADIRDIDFEFSGHGKHYTTTVINVTFKYSVRDWNCVGGTTYLKLGVCERDVRIQNCSFVEDGILKAIITDNPVEGTPVSDELLAPYFAFVDGQYKKVKEPKTVHSVGNCRDILYQKGFNCNGVHYVRWKRSSGAARVGKCLFIDSRLYPAMHDWELCGLELNEGDQIDLAGFECYIALTLSSIEGTLEIAPENILVIDDYESAFREKAISVKEIDGKLVASAEECDIVNSIWDGQALIDRSLMGTYSEHGMVLLRNRFFKSCCFNCNLQQWFADNGITDVRQLNGYTRAARIEDVKLITTPSSIKYLKYGTLDQWLDNLVPIFGMVKTEKKTHFFDGRMVQIHYQLLNSLQMHADEVDELLQPTLEYLQLLRADPAVLRHHVNCPIDDDGYDNGDYITAISNKNDIIFKLLSMTDEFAKTKLYNDFRKDLVRSLVKQFKLGKILVEGNYSTLCGNPIEMLQASIGRFDGTSQIGIDNVHNIRFSYDVDLIGSRSPHICASNVLLVKNRQNEMIDRYLNLTEEIVCINSINENILNKLAGSDRDRSRNMVTYYVNSEYAGNPLEPGAPRGNSWQD